MVLGSLDFHNMALRNTGHLDLEPVRSSLEGWGISGICNAKKM